MTTADLFRAHLANIGKPENLEIYSSDLEVEFVYAPPNHTAGLQGVDAVVRFLKNVGVYFEGYTVTNLRFIEATDPNVVVAQFHGTAVSTETGKAYEQDYIVIVTARDGQIAHLREFYDPLRVLVSTGEIEDPAL